MQPWYRRWITSGELPTRRATSAMGTPAFSHRVMHACRRSYGRPTKRGVSPKADREGLSPSQIKSAGQRRDEVAALKSLLGTGHGALLGSFSTELGDTYRGGMNAEIGQLVEQAGPYLTAALGAYGAGVLSRAEDSAVEATANLGRRLLHAVWQRRDEQGRAELEAAVQDAAEEPVEADAAAAVRQQIKRAMREDAELRQELAGLLATAPSGVVTVTASGERAIAAQTIATAISGDNAQIGR